MIVDEKKKIGLYSLAQKRKKRVIESDHSGLLLKINILFSYKKTDRQDMFNLKYREGHKI